jgi:hypothetical protein
MIVLKDRRGRVNPRVNGKKGLWEREPPVLAERSTKMPERKLTPEDEQPLARTMSGQPLAKTPGTEQEEAPATTAEPPEETPEAEHQEAPQPEREPGLVEKIVGEAQERGLVDSSTVEKARQKGFIDKAEEVVEKARRKLSGG